MKSLPELVDANGDINLHGRQSADITVRFLDDNGNVRDMTGRTVTWECGPGVNKTMTVGSASNERILSLTNADVKVIYNQTIKAFVALDTTGGGATPLWEGSVFITGWIE